MTWTLNRSRYAPLVLLLAALLLLPAGWTTATAEEDGEKSRWNADLAASYQHFFSPFSEADTMAALQMMPVDLFLTAVKTGEPPVVLDVRTPGETGVLGITLPNCLTVPMDQVFTTKILDKLEGRKVVVVCMAGHRATAVALALRHIGLSDIWILKGGTAGLAAQLDPKSAY